MPKLVKPMTVTQLKPEIEKLDMLPHGGRFAVGGVPGLYLRVGGQASNTTHWVLCAALGTRTNQSGKEVVRRLNIGLGPYPEVTLAKARERAIEIRADIRAGIDPLAERRADAAQRKTEREAEAKAKATAKTFKWCAEQVIEQKGNELTNAKALAQWKSTLETYVYPVKLANGLTLGESIVGTLTKHDVAAALKPIWNVKVETARRVRMRVESVFSYARVHDLFTGDNPATNELINGILGGNKKKDDTHFAALPYSDLPAFMTEVRANTRETARMLEFLILTATRTGEVRFAEWPEIDLQRRIWTIPAGRMKAGTEHVVSLSDGAVKLLESLPRYDRCALVFPNDQAAKVGEFKPYSENALLDLRDDMKRSEITIHGFRSAFRDWAGETTAHPREVIEHALAHQLKDKAEAAYARSTLLPKRRALMQDWAAHCGYHRENNVLPLDQAAA